MAGLDPATHAVVVPPHLANDEPGWDLLFTRGMPPVLNGVHARTKSGHDDILVDTR